MLTKSKPEEAKKLFAQAQVDADRRWKFYQFLSGRDLKGNGNGQHGAQTGNHRGPTTMSSMMIYELRLPIDTAEGGLARKS